MGRLSAIAVVVALVFAETTGPSALAQEGEMIYACLASGSGRVRIVDLPSDCRDSEDAVSWSIQGPEGPQGAQGDEGPQGPEGPAGPDGVAVGILVTAEPPIEDPSYPDWPFGVNLFTAEDVCGDLGLPVTSELYENENDPNLVLVDEALFESLEPDFPMKIRRKFGGDGGETVDAPVTFAVQCVDFSVDALADFQVNEPPEQRVAFATSALYTADLGLLEGAEAICNNHAQAGSLDGNFLPFLFDSAGNNPVLDEIDDSVDYVYKLVDGTPVVEAVSDLRHFGPGPVNPINRDETGALLPDEEVAASYPDIGDQILPAGAWVGSIILNGRVFYDGAGALDTPHCQDWNYSVFNDFSRFGSSNIIHSSGPGWLASPPEPVPSGYPDEGFLLAPCFFKRHLYCFEQPFE
jgi:hypothetical protein